MGVRMVLANGEVVTFGGKSVKNVAGYDLTKLGLRQQKAPLASSPRSSLSSSLSHSIPRP